MSMMWNPTTHADYDDLKGFDVYTSDNEKLGTIKEIFHPAADMPAARGQHVFKVEPGMLKELFTDDKDVYVSERMIRAVDTDDDKVILEVPKASIEQQDWSRPKNFDTYRTS